MSLNNGILFNDVLGPRILNNPFALCSFMNPYFLLLNIPYFDNNIVLTFLVLKTF